jgi:glucosamine--fructose-6-phosphate aminotransferase (isomerizing)
MCGIIGYIGSERAMPIVVEGLSNLEYRGYDSVGVAVCDGSLTIHKTAGELKDLSIPTVDGTCAIGHTRWSTHGDPTDANAHPHTDCEGDVAVVHNGIIENYDSLRAELSEHRFTSETDSEVIPHLIEEEWAGNDLVGAVESVINRLEGSFAIGVVTSKCDEIVVARQDSPLVIGHGETGRFVASDVPAFIEHTREVSHLENGDIARLTSDAVRIYNDGEAVERNKETLDWTVESDLDTNEFYETHSAIVDQPQALRNTLTGRIDELDGRVNVDIGLSPADLDSLERVQFVGEGSGYRSALYAARLFERYAGVSTDVDRASEYRPRNDRDLQNTLVVAVTYSGESERTLSAVRRANRSEARTLAITAVVGSTITRRVDDIVYTREGPALDSSNVKSFPAQVVTLTLVAIHIGRTRGVLPLEKAWELIDRLQRLPTAVQHVLSAASPVRKIAGELSSVGAYYLIARDIGYPVAAEGAATLREVAGHHAEAVYAGDLTTDGYLNTLGPETGVIAVLTEGASPAETVDVLQKVRQRESPVLGIVSDPEYESSVDAALRIPEFKEFEPLLAGVYLQMVATYVAIANERGVERGEELASYAGGFRPLSGAETRPSASGDDDEIDRRLVETVWTERLQNDLPADISNEMAERYVELLLADPRLVMSNPTAEQAIEIVETLLDRHPPMEVYDIDISDETWESLRESFLRIYKQGVKGERWGPTSVAPSVDDNLARGDAESTGLIPTSGIKASKQSDADTGIPGPASSEATEVDDESSFQANQTFAYGSGDESDSDYQHETDQPGIEQFKTELRELAEQHGVKPQELLVEHEEEFRALVEESGLGRQEIDAVMTDIAAYYEE